MNILVYNQWYALNPPPVSIFVAVHSSWCLLTWLCVQPIPWGASTSQPAMRSLRSPPSSAHRFQVVGIARHKADVWPQEFHANQAQQPTADHPVWVLNQMLWFLQAYCQSIVIYGLKPTMFPMSPLQCSL